MAGLPAVQRQLQDGIKAINKGNRVRGRELLMQVVEQDANNEQAWWWLSQVMDDPRERMRALEQVVRISPGQSQASDQLIQMRQSVLQARASTNAHWQSLRAETPPDADDGVDAAYQCPYCGLDTDVDDRKCPHCGGGLVWRVAKAGDSQSLRLLLLLLAISLAVGLLDAMGPAFALAASQSAANRLGLEPVQQFMGVRIFLGDFLSLAPAASVLLLQIYAVRSLLLLALILGLNERWRLAYYATMLGVLADFLLALYLLMTGALGYGGVALNLLLGLGLAIVLFSVNYEFAVNHERLLVKPDSRAHSAQEFFERGHHYRRLGMWAMAVAQWRRAVGLAPGMAHYYKDLGIGYAQIKRFDRSLQALDEAQRQAPHDQAIGEIIALVQARAHTHRQLRR